MPRSTTLRIALSFILLFGGGSALLLGGVFFATSRFLLAQVDQAIEEDVALLLNAARERGPRAVAGLVVRRARLAGEARSVFLLADAAETETLSPSFSGAGDKPVTAFPVGTRLTVRLLQVGEAPAAAPLSSALPLVSGAGPALASASLAPGGTADLGGDSGVEEAPALTGAVRATGGGALPLVETPLGVLALRGTLSAAPGTPVVLQVVAVQPPVVSAPPPPAGATGPFQTPSAGWPALQESLALLEGEASVLLDKVPRLGPALTAAVTSFVAAQRPGAEGGRWPGEEAVRALERTGRRGADLARALVREAEDLGPQPLERDGASWVVHTVPLWHAGEITPIRLITRRGGAEADEEGTGGAGREGERFWVEVSLSRLGPLQIDGLYRRTGRQLDLVIRTARPFPTADRQRLTALTHEAVTALGLSGSLRFETTRPPAPPVPVAPLGGEGRGLIA